MGKPVKKDFENHFERMRGELTVLAKDVEKALGGNMIGFYVTGSLAVGNWNPKTSDIDVCIVVRRALTENEEQRLEHVHRLFLEHKQIVAGKLEGEYVTLQSLRDKDYTERVGSIALGRFAMKHNNLSHDNLVGLNENSIALVGPAFHSLGVVVTPQELAEAEYGMLREDRAEAETETDFEKKLYLLINSLRCVFTLKTGKLPTKRGAVEAGRELVSEDLYHNLVRYLSGDIREFAIPNSAIVSVIDYGLGLKRI